MSRSILTVEDCPKCNSDNVDTYWWQRGQAWIVICQDCRHEAGREDSERQAVNVWNREALAHPTPGDSPCK